MPEFEKLGVFYLGKRRDLGQRQTGDELVLYDSRDLTTHAVVVGMTGSGKTGLCVTILEEAGLDRIPSIVIDPKGDVSNLLLTFPDLAARDFLPWIDPREAERASLTPERFADAEATKWRQGLAEWGQDGNRIRALRDAVEMRLYTPGSNAGRPLTILQGFAAPAPEARQDEELFRERVASAVAGLLGLLGIEADPIRSREHILISKIIESAWSSGKDVDLGSLIEQIQSPPFGRVGVMETDAFFPLADRRALAMSLNNLLASPTFSSWMQGEPLDIKRLLYTEAGKPCISILSIAHLSDPQRMFFVTILLNEILAWIRQQSGTSSLRAIVYMDEVFGYFPPTANPPSKQPMLTLLKQARAYGLGIVLATQNPVDLDYKGLSNAGTWFLGRLQTERDKLRVLDGLEGASAQSGAKFDRSETEQTLAGLGRRVFLMNNVHEDHSVLFETRWAMSYLCGPLTRANMQTLAQTVGGESVGGDEDSNRVEPPLADPAPLQLTTDLGGRRLIPQAVTQVFAACKHSLDAGEPIIYRPALFAQAQLYYSKASCEIDAWLPQRLVVENVLDDTPENVWNGSRPLEDDVELSDPPQADPQFTAVPDSLQRAQQFPTWEKQLRDHLYRDRPLRIWSCPELKVCSRPAETEGDFRIRLEQLASEQRDREIDSLRKKYAPKLNAISDRIQRGEAKIEREREQYQQRRLDSILHTGSTILGALLGRKRLSATNVSKASTSMRSYGRAASAREEIERSEESLESLNERMAALQAEFDAELAGLRDKLRVADLTFDEIVIRPRKSDIQVEKFGVLWLPYRVDSAGNALSAFV